MNGARREKTITEESLHWGIFTLPIAVAIWLILAVALPPLLYCMFLKRVLLAVAGAQLKLSFVGAVLPIAIVPGVLAGLLLFVLVLFSYRNSSVRLTDERVVFRTGVLRRLTGELPLENIESVILSESLLGRICGYCTVIITSFGSTRYSLPYLPSSREFEATLRDAVSASTSDRHCANGKFPMARFSQGLS